MTYAINPVDGAYELSYLPGTGFPPTFRYLVMSCWGELKNDTSGLQMIALGYNVFQDANRGALMWVTWPGDTAPRILNIEVSDGTQYGGLFRWFGAAGFDMSALVAGVYYNFLVSIDSVGQVIQVYVNDTPLAFAPHPPTWYAATEMAAPTSGGDGSSPGTVAIEARNNFVGSNPCVADAWWGVPGSFFDLTIVSNRRKFINADLSPVFLGANGELPLGTTPQVYATVPPHGAASAFLTNRGITGGSFVNSGAGVLCIPDTPVVATLAELWFSNTSGFVDLTDVANRRKFISNTGGAQNLGDNGELPLSVTPPVFLTTNNLPVTFPGNNGRGGPFIVTGAALVAGASDPPGSTSSVTTGAPLPAGNGVLGDYRNGNLYAFNPATYTDNGTRRKWVRRWRGLPRGTSKAVRYSYLVVEMETGTGVPPADNPQLVLRWSDDGGHTWSAERYRPVGKLGETAQSIKFNRLGSSPRFAGSDRIFELSSTDPFKVAIIDAEVETSPPT